MTVKELEEVGCTVRVTHFRPASFDMIPTTKRQRERFYTRYDLRRLGATGSAFKPTGGLTLVVLVLPTGEGYMAFSTCSRSDNFSKKRGREIALGRAWAEANTAYLEGVLAI